ncbi:PPC domain-containing protein [Candidatus Bipolaricaulota bacterium]|nr:PPC domain-containing protein [Candidatus Bipolaricaulota bacterium]
MKRNYTGWLAISLVFALSVAGFTQCLTEVEGNDSSAVADWVADLPGSGCIEGTIGVVGDLDYFYFDLSSARWVTIETLTNEDTEIALLDSDGNVIAQNDDIALNVYSSSIQEYLYAGRYFVAIWEHGDDNVVYNYTLNVYAEGCVTEIEDNDSLELADPIGQFPGNACAVGMIGMVGDLDVYSLTVTDWTVLTLSTVTDEDTEIALLDEYGDVLAINDDYVVGEYWSWISREVSPGTYYVIVREHGDDNVIYDYTLVVSGTSCISEIEPNDDYTLADALGSVPGEVCATGTIAVMGDIDYYTFDVTFGTNVTVWTETTGDTEIGLFDEYGNTLAENDDVSAGDTSSWIGINLAAGTYYVAVREFTDSDWVVNYTLHVTGD